MPNSQNWAAVQKATDFGGSEHFLEVTGQVEVPSTSHVAELAKAVSQGINDTILLVELTIRQEGIGNPVLTWRDVSHVERPVEPGRIRQVTIMHGDKPLTTIDVEIVHSVT